MLSFIVHETSMAKNFSPSRAPKNSAQRMPHSRRKTTQIRMNGNCGTFTVFCILNYPASVVAHQRTCQQPTSIFNELQLWDLDCLLTACTRGICWTCTTGTSNTLSMDCNWESQWSAELDQGKRPLHHDVDVDDLDMYNNGHVNNQSKVHSLALCVPVSVAYRQCPPLCQRTEERHHPLQIGKDCWNLSCVVTETSTPSPLPSICTQPWAGGVSPSSVAHTHDPPVERRQCRAHLQHV